jgi:hypothetical protein
LSPCSAKGAELTLRKVETLSVAAKGAKEGVDVGVGRTVISPVPMDGVHTLDASSHDRASYGPSEGVAQLTLGMRSGQSGELRGYSVIHGKHWLVEGWSAELLSILLNEALVGPLTFGWVGDRAGDFFVALAYPVNLAALTAGQPFLPVGDVVDVPPGPGGVAVVMTSDDVHQDPSPPSSFSLGQGRSHSSLTGGPSGSAASRRL